MFNFPSGYFPKVRLGPLKRRKLQRGWMLRLELARGSSATAIGPSATARTDLGSCYKGKYPWEVATWENTPGKLLLGKMRLRKYQTSQLQTMQIAKVAIFKKKVFCFVLFTSYSILCKLKGCSKLDKYSLKNSFCKSKIFELTEHRLFRRRWIF